MKLEIVEGKSKRGHTDEATQIVINNNRASMVIILSYYFHYNVVRPQECNNWTSHND